MRGQALRLDKYATQLKGEMKFMKEKVEAVEEDRNWLEKQLKQSKKSSKLLRAELDVRTQTVGGAQGAHVLQLTAGSEGDAREGFSGGGVGDEGSAPMFPPVRPGSQQARGYGGVEVTSPIAGAVQPPAVPYQPPVGPTHNLASALAMVDRLQKELAAERQTVKSLRSANISGLADRTELESFFLQCIDEVRCVCLGLFRRPECLSSRILCWFAGRTYPNAVCVRWPQVTPKDAKTANVQRYHRLHHLQLCVNMTRLIATSLLTKFGRKPRFVVPPKFPLILWDDRFPFMLCVGVQEPTLGAFTATDRRKVIDRLLADDYVLEALHHVIFSANQAGSAQSPQAGGLPGSAGSAGTGVLVPGVGDIPDDDDLEADVHAPGSAGSRFPTSFFPSSP